MSDIDTILNLKKDSAKNDYICKKITKITNSDCDKLISQIVSDLNNIKDNKVKNDTLKKLLNNLKTFIDSIGDYTQTIYHDFKNSIDKFYKFLDKLIFINPVPDKTFNATFFYDGHIGLECSSNSCNISKFYTTFFEENYDNIVELLINISSFNRINNFLDENGNIINNNIINDNIGIDNTKNMNMDKYNNMCKKLINKRNNLEIKIKNDIDRICNYNNIDYRNIEKNYKTIEEYYKTIEKSDSNDNIWNEQNYENLKNSVSFPPVPPPVPPAPSRKLLKDLEQEITNTSTTNVSDNLSKESASTSSVTTPAISVTR